MCPTPDHGSGTLLPHPPAQVGECSGEVPKRHLFARLGPPAKRQQSPYRYDQHIPLSKKPLPIHDSAFRAKRASKQAHPDPEENRHSSSLSYLLLATAAKDGATWRRCQLRSYDQKPSVQIAKRKIGEPCTKSPRIAYRQADTGWAKGNRNGRKLISGDIRAQKIGAEVDTLGHDGRRLRGHSTDGASRQRHGRCRRESRNHDPVHRRLVSKNLPASVSDSLARNCYSFTSICPTQSTTRASPLKRKLYVRSVISRYLAKNRAWITFRGRPR